MDSEKDNIFPKLHWIEDKLKNYTSKEYEKSFDVFKELLGTTDTELDNAIATVNYRTEIIEKKLLNIADSVEGVKEIKGEFKILRDEINEKISSFRENINGLESFIEENSPSYSSVLDIKIRTKAMEDDFSSVKKRLEYLEEKRKFAMNTQFTIITIIVSIVTFIAGYLVDKP